MQQARSTCMGAAEMGRGHGEVSLGPRAGGVTVPRRVLGVPGGVRAGATAAGLGGGKLGRAAQRELDGARAG